MSVNMKSKRLTKKHRYSMVNSMNKGLIILVLTVIIVGIIGGFFWQSELFNSKQNTPTIQNQLSENKITISSSPSTTSAPTPTYPPYSLKIDNIDETFIYVKNEKGTIRLSRSKVKVFNRSGGQLIPATLNDLKITQNVTVIIVEAGKESHIIIEP